MNSTDPQNIAIRELVCTEKYVEPGEERRVQHTRCPNKLSCCYTYSHCHPPEGLTLILGATGKTGQRVVSRLHALNQPIRLGSRNAIPALDWTQPASWDDCLERVTSVYLNYPSDLPISSLNDRIAAFVHTAKRHGVRRLVLLTGRGEYEVTGPRLLTVAEATAELSQALGRTIKYQQIPQDVFLSEVEEFGAPPHVVWLMDHLFGTVLDGRNAYLADGVQRSPQRSPKDFADFAREFAYMTTWRNVA